MMVFDVRDMRKCTQTAKGEVKYKMTSDLEDVVSWPYIRHINPLTVDIVAICIPTAHRDTLIPHVIAGEALLDS